MDDAFHEHEFLKWIAQRNDGPSARLPVGPGDDAAIIVRGEGADLLLAMDVVCEGVHLEAGPDLPERLARKAVRSNLSDIAAMGGVAEAIVVGLELPVDATDALARRVMEAVREETRRFGVELAGGDSVMRPGGLSLGVAVTGRPHRDAVLRSGARPGDLVLVTGALGGSILGRHHDFIPRLEEATALVDLGPPSAMTDISDGFLRDLSNILEASGVGAVVDAAAVPISDAAAHLAARTDMSPLEHALHDGEDFELLFTMDSETAGRVLKEWKLMTPLTVTGKVVERGLWLQTGDERKEVAPGGYEHGRP
ncbi:MAG TPA: thiamine-monophosphate kinase [Planctomycetes bacterium]|nr:thiamine-monophosphate kinase [Planctomycetota bacterium]